MKQVVGPNVSRRLPDFLIAGAPRCGTTWLYHLLDRHPDVFMAKPVKPEPKFFLVDELYARGPDYYAERWFSNVPPGQVAGEKSTNYLESEVAAQRIRETVPRIKLVFILREPAARAYSNYLWSRMNGLESDDFETALERERHREQEYPVEQRVSRPHSYFSRGLYARLLRPYYDAFPGENILILKYDEMVASPGRLAARLHRFLGISERPGDADGLSIINASESQGVSFDPGLRRRLSAAYVEPNRELASLTGLDVVAWGAAQ